MWNEVLSTEARAKIQKARHWHRSSKYRIQKHRQKCPLYPPIALRNVPVNATASMHATPGQSSQYRGLGWSALANALDIDV